MTNNTDRVFDESGCGWISRGFEELVSEIHLARRDSAEVRFDVLIVGSGYGGAVAAMNFAGRRAPDGTRIRVGLLERGSEYLPGSFPATPSEVPGHLRIASHKEGLFDVRVGPEVTTVIANGLGGGSLINAGVMEVPQCSVFGKRWPHKLRNGTVLDRHFALAKFLLGASIKAGPGRKPGNHRDNTIEVDIAKPVPKKFDALKKLANGNRFRAAAITVALENSNVTSGGVKLDKCIRCGDCATGCNHNAKNSLDVNLLVSAHRSGAEIYTGATVLSVERDADGWLVNAVYTSSRLRKRHGRPVKIRTRKLILAAGTLGSTEILMRSRSDKLRFSNLLGHRCSTNGDMLITDYDTDAEVNTVADEIVQPSKRNIGPTITGIIDLRNSENPSEAEQTGDADDAARDPQSTSPGLVIEEMSVPAGLRRVFSEVFATSNTLHSLAEFDGQWHGKELPKRDIYSSRPEQLLHTALYAVMGNDTAGGRVALSAADDNEADGTAHLRWPGLPSQELFGQQVDAVTRLSSETGGRIMPSPLWKLMSPDMEFFMSGQRGPLVTVHPLGGCAMADDVTTGVVNEYGQVFRPANASADAAGNDVYEDLAVLDGSIIPTALGTNPALTIAAVALRATKKLASIWQYSKAAPAATATPATAQIRPPGLPQSKTAQLVDLDAAQTAGAATQHARRPFFREAKVVDRESHPQPTEVRITERLCGKLRFKPQGGTRQTYVVELTLRFKPAPIAQLMEPGGTPTLHLDTRDTDPITDSRIRIFDVDQWEANKRSSNVQTGCNADDRQTECGSTPFGLDDRLDRIALFSAPLTGSLTMFERYPSGPWQRTFVGLWAYLNNRGWRDIFQRVWPALPKRLWRAIVKRSSPQDDKPQRWSAFRRVVNAFAIASRAGEVRLEEYRLRIGANQLEGTSPEVLQLPEDACIHALKRFTYSRRCNPWRQLMEVDVDRFPGLGLIGDRSARRRDRTLNLDLDFLANIRVPLYEITRQDNAVQAMAELGSYAAWFTRMLIGIHLWTFRLPDPDTRTARPQLLPNRLGKTAPEIRELVVNTERPHFERSAEPVTARIRLTRYARPDSDKPPLVMIHGYSASGTTFAHPAIKPNIAEYFFNDKKRDVWIVDLRTSPGMPTASRGWSFEQVAFNDVPAALCYVNQQTESKIDVLAHCMGAAMFSMAVLHDGASRVGREYDDERVKLPDLINKAVLSQVGPLVVFSPANRVRALLARFMTEFLPDRYSFNPGPEAELADDLLDRLLYSVPYPEEEFEIENPRAPWARTPWVRTRHRMDALFGRAMNVDSIDPEVLKHIDDLFGPLSIRTVAQTIHFADLSTITNARGRNTFVSRENLREFWKFPTLGVHGRKNGLSDVATQDRLVRLMAESDVPFRSEIFDDLGHQDSLIGRKRLEVLDKIDEFLAPPGSEAVDDLPRNSGESQPAAVPWIGPLITQHFSDDMATARQRPLTIRIASAPFHRAPVGVALLPARVIDNRIVRNDGKAYTERDLRQNIWFYKSDRFIRENWDSFLVPPALLGSAATGFLVLIIYPDAANIDKFARTINGTDEPADSVNGAPDRHEYFYLGGDRAPTGFDPATWTANSSRLPMPCWEAIAASVHARLAEQPDIDAPRRQRVRRGDRSLLDGFVPFTMPTASVQRGDIRFALGSCQYQTSFLDAGPGYSSYRHLARRIGGPGSGTESGCDKRIDGDAAPQFLVLTGDQIYVDATAGLLDASVKDDDRHDKPYARWLRDRHVRRVLRQIPSFMMLDDHEIEDNWEPLGAAQANFFYGQTHDAAAINNNRRKLEVGRHAYLKYQYGRMGDALYRKLNVDPADLPGARGKSLSYTFRQRGHPFFMLDTRTGRGHRTAATVENAHMINDEDRDRLEHWLTSPVNEGPKFIVSPAMILPQHINTMRWGSPLSALHSDGWDGFPATLKWLLAFIYDEKIAQVVFLSGDEHRACCAAITLTSGHSKHAVQAQSLHTAPAYAPFTFANSVEENFSRVPLDFVHKGKSYRCVTRAQFPDCKDGFTDLGIRQQAGVWYLDVAFADCPRETISLGPAGTLMPLAAHAAIGPRFGAASGTRRAGRKSCDRPSMDGPDAER